MKLYKFLLSLSVGLLALSASAQNRTVTGTVTDGENGDPVPFASIVVKGTSNWTTTDLDGKYAVSAPANGVLSVEIIGYVSQEVSIGARTVVDIVLDPDLDQLDESVVIGYGVQQKKLLTGSTVQVKGDDLARLNTASALGALQSQSPGVTITQNSGQPGRGYKVNIRGIGTIGDSEPLYVIDGVAGGDINALNPNDIESIDILKDAASAAIYGARAANGVVLVTTKQGKEGRVIVSYDGFYGAQYLAKLPDMVNAQEYIQLYNLARKNSGLAEVDFATKLPAKLYQSVTNGSWKGTNWVEEMYNKGAMSQNHSLNVAGGTAEHKFSMGLSYTGQDGVLGYNKLQPMNAQYRRYTFRMNSDNVVVKRNNLDILKVGETINFSFGQNSGIAEGDIYDSSLHDAIGANPLLPLDLLQRCEAPDRCGLLQPRPQPEQVLLPARQRLRRAAADQEPPVQEPVRLPPVRLLQPQLQDDLPPEHFPVQRQRRGFPEHETRLPHHLGKHGVLPLRHQLRPRVRHRPGSVHREVGNGREHVCHGLEQHLPQ